MHFVLQVCLKHTLHWWLKIAYIFRATEIVIVRAAQTPQQSGNDTGVRRLTAIQSIHMAMIARCKNCIQPNSAAQGLSYNLFLVSNKNRMEFEFVAQWQGGVLFFVLCPFQPALLSVSLVTTASKCQLILNRAMRNYMRHMNQLDTPRTSCELNRNRASQNIKSAMFSISIALLDIMVQ